MFLMSKIPSLRWADTDSAMMKPKEEVSIDMEDGRRWREESMRESKMSSIAYINLQESCVDSLSCLMLEKQ